jgi:hypothetical protein
VGRPHSWFPFWMQPPRCRRRRWTRPDQTRPKWLLAPALDPFDYYPPKPHCRLSPTTAIHPSIHPTALDRKDTRSDQSPDFRCRQVLPTLCFAAGPLAPACSSRQASHCDTLNHAPDTATRLLDNDLIGERTLSTYSEIQTPNKAQALVF